MFLLMLLSGAWEWKTFILRTLNALCFVSRFFLRSLIHSFSCFRFSHLQAPLIKYSIETETEIKYLTGDEEKRNNFSREILRWIVSKLWVFCFLSFNFIKSVKRDEINRTPRRRTASYASRKFPGIFLPRTPFLISHCFVGNKNFTYPREHFVVKRSKTCRWD